MINLNRIGSGRELISKVKLTKAADDNCQPKVESTRKKKINALHSDSTTQPKEK